jgi:hypothetical protein
MDAHRFDALARALAPATTRRRVLGGLLGVGTGGGAARPLDAATAKKRRRRVRRNAFGCVNVGGGCRGKDQHCCSGICRGKKPKPGQRDTSRCVGHDASTCAAGQDSCAGAFVPCANPRSASARCVVTTGKASYCAGDVFCRACARDADCPEEEFESGAACIVCGDCAESTACATLRTFA